MQIPEGNAELQKNKERALLLAGVDHDEVKRGQP